jgi:hypothetical protein
VRTAAIASDLKTGLAVVDGVWYIGGIVHFLTQVVAVYKRVFGGNVCEAWEVVRAASAESRRLVYVSKRAVDGLEFLFPELDKQSTSAPNASAKQLFGLRTL